MLRRNIEENDHVSNRDSERFHDVVYGSPFSEFRRRDVEQTIKNYVDRFAANKADAKNVFANKTCLDAGCGYGRGSLLMLANGAHHVTAVDISANNVESATRNVEEFGFQNFDCLDASVENLPFKDEAFDVVWCYGVIHHAAETDACLQELARVLKPGGQLFIFIYGSGGIFWYSVRRFREILNSISTEKCIAGSRLMGFPTIEISNFIDSWKTSNLRCYTRDHVTSRLQDLGFNAVQPWSFGMVYDTSHRRNTFDGDAIWMGEGDLRYLVTKTREKKLVSVPLDNSEIGSQIPFDEVIVNRFGPLFDRLHERVAGSPLKAIAGCGYIHRAIFKLFRESKPFDPDAYVASFKDVGSYLDFIETENCE